MTPKLEKIATDLHKGRANRASLFWLRVFVRHAHQGVLRSDEWVEIGLREAATIPDLDATNPAPRLSLLTEYHLFQAIRARDQYTFSANELASLDWKGKYYLSLQPDVGDDSDELVEWVEALWEKMNAELALEKMLAKHSPFWGSNMPDRSHLLEVLHETQSIYGGWLPHPVIIHIAHTLNIPLANVYGVTEFYSMFYTKAVGKKIIRICQDAPCAMRGSEEVQAALCRHLQIEPGETTADGEFTLEPVRCLGLCDRAPAALVNNTRHFELTSHSISALLTNEPWHMQQRNKVGGLVKVALANVGVIDPSSLDDYRAQGGLAALRKVLWDMTPEKVIETIIASKLVGRGGAAFPTGLKWQATASNPPGPRFVICNADESEVGAFKDRVLMDGDPFRVLEGLIIACYAVGAAQGFVYVRGEHRPDYERFCHAIAELEKTDWLGENIMGSGFDCHIAVRRGAGSYVCGEETALMESIEGKRGFPRLRPPFPTTCGLWGHPTVINNVETFAKVPPIIIHGGEWYHLLGTEESAGTKLFAVSGSVKRPGVYEVTFGVTLRHLIYDLAGGLFKGRNLQAILTGGAAGTFLKPEHLDIPITFEDFKRVGGTIGAGTMMVFDDTVDLGDVLTRVTEFFAHESCGKCFLCQMGTQRQVELVRRIQNGQGQPGDVEILLKLGQVMTRGSNCGLGQAASWAVTNAVKHWPELLSSKVSS